MSEEKEIGKIEHFFGKIQVAAITITSGELKVGDVIRIKGRTTDLTHIIDSMQVNHQPVQFAKSGDSIGIKVNGQCREHDTVYRVIQ
jgi:translation elongation factor EF-1alpha